jgi:SAM-dependent methyltransferase
MNNSKKKEIINEAKRWKYDHDFLRKINHLYKDKVLLDVGMGAGPYSVMYIDKGCKKYIGVDPLINSNMVRDFRAEAGEPLDKRYHSFPYSCNDIMNVFPNITLHAGIVEETKFKNIADVCTMSAVTEHLEDLQSVFKSIYCSLKDKGTFWFSHCNYYSWTGHHSAPRDIKKYDPNNIKHTQVIDWKHLSPNHPCYHDKNLNRVRLKDLYDLTKKYFIINEWTENRYAQERLTQDIRNKYSKYNLNELLAKTIYVTCTKREKPLDIDLSNRQFHHPLEDYKVEDLPLDLVNIEHSVYFTEKKQIVSHSTNNNYGNIILNKYNKNETIILNKGNNSITLNIIDKIVKNDKVILYFDNSLNSKLLENRRNWTIINKKI